MRKYQEASITVGAKAKDFFFFFLGQRVAPNLRRDERPNFPFQVSTPFGAASEGLLWQRKLFLAVDERAANRLVCRLVGELGDFVGEAFDFPVFNVEGRTSIL